MTLSKIIIRSFGLLGLCLVVCQCMGHCDDNVSAPTKHHGAIAAMRRRIKPTPPPAPTPTPTPVPGPIADPLPDDPVDDWTPPPGIGGDTAPWINNNTKPPAAGFQAVPWIIAVADTRRVDAGSVDIDWLRCHKVVNGVDTVIVQQDFPLGWAMMNFDGSGGVFGERNLNGGTWFIEHDSIPGLSTIVKGYFTETGATGITLQPSDYPNFGAHLWGQRSSSAVESTATVWAEARVRIRGSCVVEVGVDYHSLVNTANSSGSGLVYHDDFTDWQIITSGK